MAIGGLRLSRTSREAPADVTSLTVLWYDSTCEPHYFSNSPRHTSKQVLRGVRISPLCLVEMHDSRLVVRTLLRDLSLPADHSRAVYPILVCGGVRERVLTALGYPPFIDCAAFSNLAKNSGSVEAMMHHTFDLSAVGKKPLVR